jgi:lycopene beta-cyclase
MDFMLSTSEAFDVLVVGAGPAGLAAVAALAAEGLRVGCLAPKHPPDWPNTYGVWLDELEVVALADCVEAVWGHPTLAFASPPRRLERKYARIDNEKLKKRLIERAERGEVHWLTGRGREAEVVADGVKITAFLKQDQSAQSYAAASVIDATGHFPAFVRRASAPGPAWQTAWGIMAYCRGNPLGRSSSSDPAMVLMDYRPIPPGSGEPVDAAGPASFLYGMEMGGGRYFLEETVLAARPRVDIKTLKDRLDRRLKSRGIEVVEVLDTERVAIPMGFAVPDLNQAVIGFGAAASMVHPATGYMLGRVLQAAKPLARALAEQLGRAGADPRRAARVGWESIWPNELLRTRELLIFGLGALLRLDAGQTRGFFEAFFNLEEALWAAYLSGSAAPGETARAMLDVFRQAPPTIRLGMMRGAFSPQLVHLLRAIGTSY